MKNQSPGQFSEIDVISTYTRAQALEDGYLVDVSDYEVTRQHYKYPIALTNSVWEIIDRAVKNKKAVNDYEGVIHDLLWMSRCSSRAISESARLFSCIIRGAGIKTRYDFKIVVGPGDHLEPVITIMLQGED